VSPIKRPHRWTGRKIGAPIGNAYARRHGLKSSGFFARRKEVNLMIREARALVRGFGGSGAESDSVGL
jgi:hypothetical protein